MMTNNALIKSDYLRAQAVEYGRAFIGTPYKWAGDDFSGFDCSGFVLEVLQGVGILPHKFDTSAHGLYTIFKSNQVEKPFYGCLAFWFDAPGTRAVHVMLCVDSTLVLGASGGGSSTISASDAVRDNAFVLMRPFTYRKGPVIFLDPFKGVQE